MDWGFDSILVRLKAALCYNRTVHGVCFDSILVRLKVDRVSCLKDIPNGGFDSILVRLKGSDTAPTTLICWFRFHTGSIKR